MSTAPTANFSRSQDVSGVAGCANDCARAQEADQAQIAAVADRYKKLTGQNMVTEGNLPGDFGPQMMSAGASPCKQRAFQIDAVARRLNRYDDALPAARAALDVNQVGDDPASSSKGQPCLTRLPDDAAGLNKALGLPPDTLTDEDLRNDKTGFRAAMYRSSADGQLILVARDTQPHSLVDWKSNTDNGAGLDTDQYAEMRNLAGTLAKNDVPFDLSGYSKGGGLAQEGGLMSPQSDVYVFNSAGLNDASLARTGNASFASLADRTTAFSAQGDFLTYMNSTQDPAQQIANSQYLRSNLAGQNWPLNPLSLDYSNPAALAARNAQSSALYSLGAFGAAGLTPPDSLLQAAGTDPDPGFAAAKQKYLAGIDNMISRAQSDQQAGIPFRLFPPVRANDQETIPDSMTWLGKKFGAADPGANLGKLVQHKMDNVVSSMENVAAQDRKTLQSFLNECG